MKLRILGNTLRLRLTQSEVTAFRETGRVEERIQFRPGEHLIYTLEASTTARHLEARYDRHAIRVVVPATWAATWTGTDQVGLEGEQPIEGEKALSILIEKDFQCLHGGSDRKDPDAFPHPLEASTAAEEEG